MLSNPQNRLDNFHPIFIQILKYNIKNLQNVYEILENFIFETSFCLKDELFSCTFRRYAFMKYFWIKSQCKCWESTLNLRWFERPLFSINIFHPLQSITCEHNPISMSSIFIMHCCERHSKAKPEE